MAQPVSTSSPSTINIDPAAKIVVCSAVAQAGLTQSVTVKDSGNTVKWSATGNGPTRQIGFGTFVPSGNGTYTVTLTPNSMLLAAETAVVYNGTVLVDMYTFALNDAGGDNDYNDLFVTIAAFKYAG